MRRQTVARQPGLRELADFSAPRRPVPALVSSFRFPWLAASLAPRASWSAPRFAVVVRAAPFQSSLASAAVAFSTARFRWSAGPGLHKRSGKGQKTTLINFLASYFLFQISGSAWHPQKVKTPLSDNRRR